MDRETVLKHIRSETNGFIDHNGIRVVDVDEDKSVLAAEVTDFSRNVWGNVHGGFLYTMADTAAGVFLARKNTPAAVSAIVYKKPPGCFCGPNTDTAT